MVMVLSRHRTSVRDQDVFMQSVMPRRVLTPVVYQFRRHERIHENLISRLDMWLVCLHTILSGIDNCYHKQLPNEGCQFSVFIGKSTLLYSLLLKCVTILEILSTE